MCPDPSRGKETICNVTMKYTPEQRVLSWCMSHINETMKMPKAITPECLCFRLKRISQTAKEPTASNLCCKEGSLIHIARIKKIDNYAIATAIAPQTLSAVLRSVPRKGKLKSRTQTTQNSTERTPPDAYLPARQ